MDKLQALDYGVLALASLDEELYPSLTRAEMVRFFDSFDSEELDMGLVFLVTMFVNVFTDRANGTPMSSDELFTHISYDALMRGLPHEHMKLVEEYLKGVLAKDPKVHSIPPRLPFFDWRNGLMHYALSAVDVCAKELGATRRLTIDLMRTRLSELFVLA